MGPTANACKKISPLVDDEQATFFLGVLCQQSETKLCQVQIADFEES